VIGAAFELGHAVAEITGNCPKSPARQIRQQADGNFMGAEDLKREGAFRVIFLVKIFKERLFKAGKVDHCRTDCQLIFRNNRLNCCHQMLPDDFWCSCGPQRII